MDDKKALLDSLTITRDSPPPSEGKKRYGWIILAILVLIALMAAGLWWALSSDDKNIAAPAGQKSAVPAAANPGTAQETSQATQPKETSTTATKERVLNASGYITARRMATVSAEITGRVTEILVEEGMRVEEGQLVARLDDALARVDLDLAKAQVSASEAAVKASRANLAEANRVLTRVSQLSSANYSSIADFTQAEAAVESLTADLARAEANLDISKLQVTRAQERLNDHEVRAPFAGVVIDKNAQPGEIVAPGSAGGGFTRTGICTLVDMDSLEIEVDVSESFIGLVTPGQRVEARLDAYPDWIIPARVIAIIPTANRDRATVRVRIALGEKDSRILPEMGVNVAFMENR
ncbi:acriflavin resistance protein [Iodidimonas gelatinilytica]|uniref:Acriflavin resistance protein n=1 Tax=Iodidimonas gelatinilytica TaxID=1236966 RepID=A0A5A7N2B3_9PROT|nr:efflux RND transporter periplasmic adaptor subunit [Iodidimonas gelatinilytica]GER01834.1 acriflavin resistance protein [Iodidimonas gelatinilytica]